MKSSLLIILAFMYSLPVLAQSKSDGAGFASYWGAGNLEISGVAGNVACRGTSEDAGLTQISNNSSWGDMRRDLRNYYLDYNALYYVAREINKNGAQFCKTIVTGKRGGCTGNAHTTYFEPTGDADCFWLCKHGYFGDGCSARVAYSTSPKLTTQQFGAKKPKFGVVAMAANKKKDNTNIEDKIPMFEYNKYVKCHNSVTDGDKTKGKVLLKNWASKNTQEHDIVLALYQVSETSTTITGGTTVPALQVLVQPLVVRAGTTEMCAGKGNDRAMAMVEFVGTATSVCPSDYDNYCASTNSDGICTDLLCVDPTAKSKVEQEKKQQQTENELKNMCAGYTRDSYKPGVHELYYVDKTSLEQLGANDTVDWSTDCVRYRCIGGKAFKADWQTSGDMGCYGCTGDAARFGIDTQGVCQQCVKGEIFDSNTKKCEKAKVFSKNDMRFGVGNAPSADLEKQCWTKDNPDCYKCCMMGESGAPDACQQCEALTAETPESEPSE